MHGKRAAAEQTGRLVLDYCKMAFEVPCVKEPEAGATSKAHTRGFSGWGLSWETFGLEFIVDLTSH